jgi:hypothetical protein
MVGNGRERSGTVGNGREWMRMVGNDRERSGMDENGRERSGMDENGRKCPNEIFPLVISRQKRCVTYFQKPKVYFLIVFHAIKYYHFLMHVFVHSMLNYLQIEEGYY